MRVNTRQYTHTQAYITFKYDNVHFVIRDTYSINKIVIKYCIQSYILQKYVITLGTCQNSQKKDPSINTSKFSAKSIIIKVSHET